MEGKDICSDHGTWVSVYIMSLRKQKRETIKKVPDTPW